MTGAKQSAKPLFSGSIPDVLAQNFEKKEEKGKKVKAPLQLSTEGFSCNLSTDCPRRDFSSSSEKLIHLIRRLAFHCRHNVPVGVHRDTDVGMSCSFRNHLSVNTLLDEECNVGMPEVVESDLF
jgi:hypothetical protein